MTWAVFSLSFVYFPVKEKTFRLPTDRRAKTRQEMALVVATPHPDLDIHALFSYYNSTYFENTLSSCFVEWSSPRLIRFFFSFLSFSLLPCQCFSFYWSSCWDIVIESILGVWENDSTLRLVQCICYSSSSFDFVFKVGLFVAVSVVCRFEFVKISDVFVSFMFCFVS